MLAYVITQKLGGVKSLFDQSYYYWVTTEIKALMNVHVDDMLVASSQQLWNDM